MAAVAGVNRIQMKNCPRLRAAGFPLTVAFGLAVVLPALVAVAASAQTSTDAPRGRGRGGPGGPGGHGRGFGHPVVRILDTDQDRELSAAELASAPLNLRTLDANADGTVSADELHPVRPARPAGAPTPPADRPAPPADRPTPPADRPAPPADSDHPRPLDPIMLALDANADGALSAAEIANATTSLKALDLNGDGKLTADEYRPLPPAGTSPR
jgi:hypothetical protein